MTTLIQVSALPLVHALGWTLLHLCWQGTLVALVLWCVLKVLDGRSSRWRYASACLALGMMVALPLATYTHLASAEYRSQTAMDSSAVALDTGMVLQVSAVEMRAPLSVQIAAALDHALPWILMAWFAGVIFFVVRLNVGLMVARRMRLVATSAVPAELHQAFDELRRRLGVGRTVRLMHSALVQVPTVIGWLRPVVLIPASCLSGLSTMQIEAILAHELAHIRRHDYLVSVLQSVIETLLFYHPALWWISRQVRRERECCCDEMAVAVGGDRLAYARALSVLEERRAAMPELVLGANGGVLTMRIRRLLGCKEDAAVSQFAAYAVLAILLAVAGSYGLTAARAEVNALSHAVHAVSPMELEAATPLNMLIAEPKVHPFQLKEPVMMAQVEAPSAPASPPRSFDRAVTATLDGPAHDLGPGNGMFAWSFPVYPPEAKAAGIQGVVALRVTVTNTGTVEDVQVISGPRELRQNSIDAVKQWKFDPSWDHGFSVGVKTIGVLYSLPSVVPVVGPLPPADEAAAGVKQYGGDVAAPKIIYEPWPEYTELARRDKVEGVVTVGLVVDEQGMAQQVTLLRGLGDGLDENALATVKKYQFKPGIDNGKPVAVYINVEVKFQLADSPAQMQGPSGGSQGAVPVPVAPPRPPAPLRLIVPSAPDAPGGPVRVSAGTASGMVLTKVDPVYPAIAKAAHVQGPVILHAIISKDGTVESLSVISGNGMLVDAARDAVSKWTYKPYLLNGQPTEVETSITENFSLEDSVAQGAMNQTVFTQAEKRYKELLALEGTAQGAANRAQLAQAEQQYRELLALQPNVPNIRSIDYKGLNSVTPQEVAERFSRDGVGLTLETPFDEARVLRASAELKQLLWDHGRPNATVIVTTKTIPPGVISILFDVKEGPKGATQTPIPAGNAIDGVKQIGGDVKGPVVIYQPEPEYTAEAKQAKFMGVVTVSIIVDKNGIPQNVHVTRGVGMGLDDKAVEAVKQYKFKPAVENGKPVAVFMNVEVNFEIF